MILHRRSAMPSPLLRQPRDIPHAVEHNARPVGKLVQCCARGHAAEHEHGGHAALHAGDDVGVHAVADHDGLARVAAEHAQAGAHHERVRLAAEIRLLAGGDLDRGDERAARGGDALVRRAAGVGVRADELRAREHEIRRLRERVERVGPRLADDDVIGVDVVHGDAAVIQRIEQPRLAEGVHRAAGRLVGQKGRRGQRAGVKMLLRHVEPHTPELLVQLARGHAAVIGQKQVFLVRVLQPVDELRRAGQDVVAVVDDAVHVAQEAFFRVEIDRFHVRSPLVASALSLPRIPPPGKRRARQICVKSQVQPQEDRRVQRAVVVGRDVVKPERAVHPDRAREKRQRVEQHGRVADGAGIIEDTLHHRPGDAPAAKRGTHIQPLELARRAVEPAQRDAPGRLPIAPRDVEPPVRQAVLLRRVGDLGVVVLQVEIDLKIRIVRDEHVRIFRKQLPHRLRCGIAQFQLHTCPSRVSRWHYFTASAPRVKPP